MAPAAGSAIRTVGIVGAGAWGTALAQAAARAGRQVLLLARDPTVAAAIERDRRHPRRLQDVPLLPPVRASADLADLGSVDVILLAVPAQTVRMVGGTLASGTAPLVVCAKGFDQASARRLSEVLAEAAPGRPVGALSGPNFAREIALGLPAATALAVRDEVLGAALAEALSSSSFRVYWTDDLVGVEVGGAVKNVLAIAAGVVMGLELGENARAGLIARGLAELTRLGVALGARPDTMAGLSGLGDAILTCTSLTSRNTAFGHALARGEAPAGQQEQGAPLCEGVFTAPALVRLGVQHGIDLPIVATVDAILQGRIGIRAAVGRLMRRPLRSEQPGVG